MKTGSKLSKNPVKRPCKPVYGPRTLYNGVLGPYTGCVLLPLGSPTGCPNWSYVHVPAVPAAGVLVHRGDGRRVGGYQVGTGEGYTGWVMGGLYPVPPSNLLLALSLRRSREHSDRAPCRAGGGTGGRRPLREP